MPLLIVLLYREFIGVRRFGSWTYSGFELDIVATESGFLVLHMYNGGGACLTPRSHEARRRVTYYQGFDAPYIDVTMSLLLT